MQSERPSIELFLSPVGDRGQALARGLKADALARATEGTLEGEANARPLTSPDPSGDPNSLRDQGWGVIAPRGEDGDRLLALAGPLLDKRAADQDGEVLVYRVPPDMTAAQSVAWIDRKLVDNKLNEEIPGYLLVLGRPDQVSFELQQVLAGDYRVGRVGFDAGAGPEAYEAYVDKLLGSERATARGPSPVVYFTARDGTPATEIGRRLLMQPCIADAVAQRAAGRFAASEIATIEEEDPARGADRLLAAAAGPGILFSCSHGAGAPRQGWGSLDQRRALQGALCLGGGQHLEAQTLAQAPFVPGGMWLMFACFGAGTPMSSAYYPWLTRLQQGGEHGEDLSSVLVSLPREGEPPFIAALPQAALANPDGPLAVIGHLDLAWSYGFHDVDKMSRGERHRRFHELVAQLVKGSRVGLALHGSLMRAKNQVQNELTIAAAEEARAGQELLDERSGSAEGEAGGAVGIDPRARLAHRWMVRQDLDGYIALGDPAARMAVAGPDAAARGASAIVEPARPAEIATRDATSPPATLPPATVEVSADAMEAAVFDLIAGRATPAEVAARYRVAAEVVDQWRRVYTEAGLRAVGELVARTRRP